MLNVLWEITLPLFISFLLGLLLGWLLWRWRRTQVSASQWTTLAERATAAEAALVDLQGERDELAQWVSKLIAEQSQPSSPSAP